MSECSKLRVSTVAAFVQLLGAGCASTPVTFVADAPGQQPGEESSARSCALVLCGPNTYCDDAGGEAKCLPQPSCVDQQCPEGQRCELVQLQCIRAPCPPQPSCVPAET
jgi:hypothetical protein